MGSKGAGGRWHDDDDPDAARQASAELAPPSGLSAVELACFATIIGLVFWLARELHLRGGHADLFQGLRPEVHVFASLAVAVGAFLVGLAGSKTPRMARVAGVMLASVVSVAVLYLLLFLRQSLYVTGAGIALAAGAALCSRTAVPRNQGYPAALVAAALMMIAYAGVAWSLR